MTYFMPRDWKLSDKEFATMKRLLDRQPEEKRTPEVLRAKVKELDELIDGFITGREDESWKDAIFIALQGRNMLARYVGDEERLIPEECYEDEAPPDDDPIAKRSVAIIATDMPRVGAALKQVIEQLSQGGVRCTLFTSMNALLIAITEGEVCGVIAVHGFAKRSVLSWMRHDLKYIRGFTDKTAKEYVFPPCVDVGFLVKLTELLPIARTMQEGTYVENAGSPTLEEALPTLRAHMKVPAREVKVAVIDDNAGDIAGMVAILHAWPKVQVQEIVQDEGVPLPDLDTDILLLDQQMAKGVTGTEVYRALQQKGFAGRIVSTTGGSQVPAFADGHFGAKAVITDDKDVVLSFVRFMNRLLP